MRTVVIFSLFLTASLCLSAEQPNCKLSSVALVGDQKIFSPGTKIEAVITYEIPDDFVLVGWGVTGYKPEVPTACANVFKCSENKDPRWSSYPILPFMWDGKSENVSPGVWQKNVSIDTASWPEGDYKLSLSVLFRMKDKPSGETDAYRAASFTVTMKAK